MSASERIKGYLDEITRYPMYDKEHIHGISTKNGDFRLTVSDLNEVLQQRAELTSRHRSWDCAG